MNPESLQWLLTTIARPLVVGMVTQSHALALEVANEIRAFIGLVEE